MHCHNGTEIGEYEVQTGAGPLHGPCVDPYYGQEGRRKAIQEWQEQLQARYQCLASLSDNPTGLEPRETDAVRWLFLNQAAALNPKKRQEWYDILRVLHGDRARLNEETRSAIGMALPFVEPRQEPQATAPEDSSGPDRASS